MNPRRFFVGLLLSTWFAAEAAAGLFSGTVMGRFDNPYLTGEIVDLDGSLVGADNTDTALSWGAGTNQLIWGDGDFDVPSSIVQFYGFDLTDVPSDQIVPLGIFYYLNGTSPLDTLIFGADFTLWLDGDPSVSALTTSMRIMTTLNGGVDPMRDADFLSFDGLPPTFHVFESGWASAVLYGRIVGDPEFDLTGLEFDGGEGFVDAGAIPPAPEPASIMGGLAGIGLAGFAAMRRRQAA